MPAPARKRVLRYPSLAHRDSNNVVQEINATRDLATDAIDDAIGSHTHTLADITDAGDLASADNASDVPVAPSGNLTADVQTSLEALDGLKIEADDIGPLASPLIPALPDDVTLGLDGTGAWSARNPTQVSGGEITAGTETDLRSFAPADIVSFISQHAAAGSGDVVWELDANTSITVGDATDGEGHLMTSDSAVTVTLSATATVGAIVAVAKGGAGTLTVAMGGSASYWVFGDDIGGTAATAGFTVTIAYFQCFRNTGGSAAEWWVTGYTSLATTIAGALTVTGQTNLDGVLDVDATSDFSGNMVLSGSATLTVAGLITSTAGVDANSNVTVSGNLTLDGSSKALIGSGNTQYGFAVELVTASGALDNTHLGKRVTTSGSVTVPTTPTGWWAVIILANAAHDITFDGATTDVSALGWGAGDEILVTVTSSTTAGAKRTAAANITAL